MSNKNTAIAIIGGSGLNQLPGLKIISEQNVDTPYGAASSSLQLGDLDGVKVVFLARHGRPHHIPPHKINYRANLYALRQMGVTQIISVTAVGGIASSAEPGVVVIPDQIVDYTWGREHTYYDGTAEAGLDHVDFTQPFCNELRDQLVHVAHECGCSFVDGGTYGVTQGPRLESASEIGRLGNDGCDLVGMTLMPEAALARELGICYANLSVVANWAAGVIEQEITMADIERELEKGMLEIRQILAAWMELMKVQRFGKSG